MVISRLAGAARVHAIGAARQMGIVPSGFVARSLRRATLKALVVPVVGAFGAGLAIGIAAGLLGAPTSGKKLRSRIRSNVLGLVGRRASPGER